MKYLLILLCLLLEACVQESVKPLCRHQVLAQYAAYNDAGYECELWHMKNNDPEKAKGFKYHVALKVKIDEKWQWVNQSKMSYTTTFQQPPGTTLIRAMSFDEVVDWVKK